MARIESRLARMGLVLPLPLVPPGGIELPFRPVRVVGRRAIVSGHGPLAPDGTVARPLGKVGGELSLEQGQVASRLTGLAMLASLQRELGDLDRITAWTRVFGMVNATPEFERHPAVLNGFSDLVLELFGPEIGAHARSAVGMSSLPFQIPVEIEAEIEFS